MPLDKINTIVLYIPLVVGLLMFAYVFARNWRGELTVGSLKKLILFFALFLVALAGVKIFLQYEIYKNDPFSQLMIPPYQSWDWFAYSMWRVNVAPLLFSMLAGAFMYAAAIFTDARFKRELFVEQDPYIFVLAALAIGWPNFVMFLALAAILTVAQSAVISLVKKDFAHRVVITNVLLASAVLVLLFGNIAGQYLKIWLLTI